MPHARGLADAFGDSINGRSGPKDNFGSCIVEHDFEPRGVLNPFTRNQARLIMDLDLPRISKPRAEGLCERLHQFLLKFACLVLFHARSFASRLTII